MEQTYEAYRYAADGHAGEPGDGEIIATGTLAHCREQIAMLLGAPHAEGFARDLTVLDGHRWSGLQDDEAGKDDIEAYHESDEEGCGGWAIRPART